jgi:rubredoxin
MNARVPDDERMPEAVRTMKRGDWVQCNGCDDIFIWDKLPDDNVVLVSEFHGQPHLTPERVPIGWVCPDCGHYNKF